MSGTRKFWIVTEALVVILGALIISLPLFTSCPVSAALIGVMPVIIGLFGFGLWTIGGKGL